MLNWEDVIDRTALGFDQIKPPGLAELAILGPDGKPVAPADAVRNHKRTIEIPCGEGPIVAVSGRFVQTSVTTTVRALLDGEPIPAKACDPTPIMLPAGQQELLISPGSAFFVDGVSRSRARWRPRSPPRQPHPQTSPPGGRTAARSP